MRAIGKRTTPFYGQMVDLHYDANRNSWWVVNEELGLPEGPFKFSDFYPIPDESTPTHGPSEQELEAAAEQPDPGQQECGAAGGVFAALGLEVGGLVDEKQKQYGDSFNRAGAVMRLLYPDGIKPEQMDDALSVVRIVDKLFRIATDNDPTGESPYRDIAGYGLLGAWRAERVCGCVSVCSKCGDEVDNCECGDTDGWPAHEVEKFEAELDSRKKRR